jgi:hypothetical protein
MYFGHIAVGLAAKPLAPKTSLGVLLVSAIALDTLIGVFLVTGVEHVDLVTQESYIPWSHGLLMSVVWSVVAFALAFLVSRDRRTSLVIGLLVFSHWVLDFISHPMFSTVPDLPLFFDGSPKVGLGLYSTPTPAYLTEFGLLAAGSIFYLVRTKANDRTGKWAFWALMLFLAVMSFSAAIPGIPIVLPLFAANLLLPIGIWVDRHRSVRAHSLPSQVQTRKA